MITFAKSKINGDIYKPKRSISSKIGNDDNEENNNLRGIKTRHRKMASSYFLGSYVSGDELNKFLQEFKGINNDNSRNSNKKANNDLSDNNSNIFKQNYINNLKNCLLNGKTDKNSNNNENFKNKEKIVPLANTSFYSYSVEEDNNDNKNKNNENEEEGSGIIKGGDESLTNNCETKSNSYINNTNSFNNNPFYELEKNCEKYSKEKSFIPIKNALKYIIDKEERVTDSYLMALNGGESNQKNGKNPYLPTASIIEEEKSEFIESTSKKQSLINVTRLNKDINFKKKKIENEFELVKDNNNILEKSNEDEIKENLDSNIKISVNNNSIKKKDKNINGNIIVKKCPKISLDLNKVIIKNNNKDEIKRRHIRKNKENLLNSFYNLSCNRSIPFPSSNNSCVHKKVGNICCNRVNNNQKFNNKNFINNNLNNKIINIINRIKRENKEKNKDLNKTSSKSLIKLPSNIYTNRKKRTFSYSGGYITYLYNQRFNTENSSQKNNEKMKYNISKFVFKKKDNNLIYHIFNNNCKSHQIQKKLNQSMNNPLLSKIKNISKNKIPHKKYDKLPIKNKNNDNSNKIIKIHIKNNINDKIKNKIFLDLSHRRAISISRDNIDKNIYHKKILSSNIDENKSMNDINKVMSLLCLNIKSNLDKNNNTSNIKNKRKKQNIKFKDNYKIPTYSDSSTCRTRHKIRDRINNNILYNNCNKKYLIRKRANSGLFSPKTETENDIKKDFDINISNKNQTSIILKEKINYIKSYEKNDVLEKINKTLNSNKSSFIILCDKKDINHDIFNFSGLFKYYENQKRFIKIYGNEKCPNVILIKDINNMNYNIYENKIIQTEDNKTQFFFEPINSFYFSFNSIIICKK